jgi:hypothetical protein
MLRICQVAPADPQAKTWQRVCLFPTHGRQKRCSKLKGKMTENKEHQPLTSGHKTLGVKWLFEHRFSHQSSLYLDSEVASKSPTFHTANRYAAA